MSLAECSVISNQLQQTVVGKKIANVIANQNPHTFVWFAMEPKYAFCGDKELNDINAKQYGEYLIGQEIEKSVVYGGWNYLYIGKRILLFVIPARYYLKDEALPKRHQLLLTFEDGTSLAFCGSLGGPVFLFEKDKDDYPIDFKPSSFPSVLSEDFSESFFMDFIKNTELRSLCAKAFLATKNRIPGIDNYILHEILWEAKVNPKSKMVNLSETDYKNMYYAIKKVFPEVIDADGLDTQKDLFGNMGKFITKASKNTLGKPCSHCGDLIVKESYLGGVIYYCPECQPFKKN